MNLIFKAPFNATYGYARVIDLFLKEFPKHGVNLHCQSVQGVAEKKYLKYIKPIPQNIYETSPQFIVFPISFDLYNRNYILNLQSHRPRIAYTMWECTHLNSFLIKELNEVPLVVVPCTWNKEIFQADGVTTPIHVVPLCVDTHLFHYEPPRNKDVFVFATGNNDYRKRLWDVITAFCRAFHPRIKDVKLTIKISPNNKLTFPQFADERIEVIGKDWSQGQLAEWYWNSDVFVSGAYAEGWGLMQHESMACGRPVIACHYGGIKDFFDKDVGYCLDYKEVLADGPYIYSGGFWADFDQDDMVDKMRWCYNHREDVYKKGILSAEKVKNLNENNTMTKIMESIHYISEKESQSLWKKIYNKCRTLSLKH